MEMNGTEDQEQYEQENRVKPRTLTHREWATIIDNAVEWSASPDAPQPRQKRGRKPIHMEKGRQVGVYTVMFRLTDPKYRGRAFYRCLCQHAGTKDISGTQLRYWERHTPPSHCCGTRPARPGYKMAPYKTLTNEQAADVRRIYAKGDVTQQALAERYGVTILTIGNIIRRKTHTGEPRKPKRRKTRYVYDEGTERSVAA